MEKVKLTKSAVNKFLSWSKSRYNDYLGYGSKKWNVDRVYWALIAGDYNGDKTFIVQCASSVGENGNGRSWKTKSGGDERLGFDKPKTKKSKK